MKRVRKLTHATLKRIIAEERQKLEKEEKTTSKKDILKELALLLKIKRAQKKKVLEVKKLHEARMRLKKSIVERI